MAQWIDLYLWYCAIDAVKVSDYRGINKWPTDQDTDSNAVECEESFVCCIQLKAFSDWLVMENNDKIIGKKRLKSSIMKILRETWKSIIPTSSGHKPIYSLHIHVTSWRYC